MAEKFRGLKQSELQQCVCCGLGVAHDNGVVFFRLQLEQMGLKIDAIRRQHGLEQILGGGSGNPERDNWAGAIAMAMGSNEDLAIPIFTPIEILVCMPCALERALGEIWEKASDKKDPPMNPALAPKEKPLDG